ncbi:MAG: BtaA family protein [Bacilli bacterium]|nr:BtaA family protein [Bacilli bacterium]
MIWNKNNSNKDIKMMEQIIENHQRYHGKYKTYTQIPLKGTENLHDLFYRIRGDYTSSLIVSGSLDQTLEAVKHDAKEIRTFDINRLSEYGIVLKYGAILALEYEEFIRFFGLIPGEEMSKKFYSKIREVLDDETRKVWDHIFDNYPSQIIFNNLFDKYRHQSIDLKAEKELISIYSKKGYKQIRKKLWDVMISFTGCNLLDIDRTTLSQEQYDFIYLSNIRYYLKRMSNYDYAKFIYQTIVPMLKEDGVAIVHYLYGQGSQIIYPDINGIINTINSNQNREELYSIFNEFPDVEARQIWVDATGYGQELGIKDVAISLRRK